MIKNNGVRINNIMKKKENPIQRFFDACPDYVGIVDGSKPLYRAHIPEKNCFFGCNCYDKPVVIIQWSQKGRGFGEYTFYMEKGKLYLDSECDSKSQVALVLFQLVNKAILVDKFKKRKTKCSSKAQSTTKQKSQTKTLPKSHKDS